MSEFNPLSTGTTYVDPRQTASGFDWGNVVNNALGGFFAYKTAAVTQPQYGAGQVPQTRTYTTPAGMDMTPIILLGGFGLAAVLLLRGRK